MKKTVVFIFFIFFVQFIIFRGLFTSLDSCTPLNTSGNPFAVVIELITSFITCWTIFVIALIEKSVNTSLKYVFLFLLYLHCIIQFYCIAFYEYNLFHDSQSFDRISKIIILSYFVFELFMTFYLVKRLYKYK